MRDGLDIAPGIIARDTGTGTLRCPCDEIPRSDGWLSVSYTAASNAAPPTQMLYESRPVLSIETTCSQARGELATLPSRVSDDHEIVIIRRGIVLPLP